MANNRDGSRRRPLQQSPTESRQHNHQLNNEPGFFSDASVDYAALPPHSQRITRYRSQANPFVEFHALPGSSSPPDDLPESSEPSSESLSSSTDSGLRNFTPENSDSSMYDPDFDIEAVSESSQSETEDGSDQGNPPFFPFDDRFLRYEGRLNYHQLRQREIFENRYVKLGLSDTFAVIALITGTGLMNTITDVPSFPREIILEFYANFGGTLDGRVFLRGSMFEFSPGLINRLYKTPDVEHHPVSETDRVRISDNLLARHLSDGRCIYWCRQFSPEIMPRYLATLFRICCYNWIPTKNISEVSIECAKLLFMVDQGIKFNFGKLVYDEIVRVARSPGHLREIIPFANLIYNVLDPQRCLRLKTEEYAKLLLPVQTFDASLQQYRYNTSADPTSSNTIHTQSLGDDLRSEAHEFERQGNELHTRAMHLRTIAAKMDGAENEALGFGRTAGR